MTIKTLITAEILDRLSSEAKAVLSQWEENIDTFMRCEIPNLFQGSDFDNLWVQLLALRIWRDRFLRHWNTVCHDPRFPNFRKANINDMLMLSDTNTYPAEAVWAVANQFAPSDYDPQWILDALSERIRPGVEFRSMQ